ncbi:LysR family transcriptional regulator [Chromobacterium alticapitis]|uniref:LysR family transcriptional regulator n=1 Tax=Chromobacterium alticapitis TaxID=2073169 RepID=A0A2S5DB24_9NEIS|nr:LysR family transcriptional regulator [Chromobacterium alticapitis]POZ60192.1 LysR family transcriptional regulator [Chromobacterium alticapitis]
MQLRHLRYFAATAEYGSVRLAAEHLHVSQPAVSRQIQALEQELGFPLFERSPRGLALTPAGGSYLRDVAQAMALLDAAAHNARRIADGLQGRLRLGCVENAGWDGAVPQALSRFQQAFPGTRIELSAMNSPQQWRAVADGALDGGFLYQFEALPDELLAVPVRQSDAVLALPRAWGLAHDEAQPFDLRAAAGRPFVMMPREVYPAYYDRLIAECRCLGVALQVTQEAATETAILSLVCAGIGAAIVNSANLGRPPAQARFYALRDFSVPMPLVFVHRREAKNPVLARFLATLRAELGSGGDEAA